MRLADPRTAAKHYAKEDGLILAEVDPAALPSPPRWEPSRGGQSLPHLYAVLPLASVVRTWTLRLDEGGRHVFPDDLR